MHPVSNSHYMSIYILLQIEPGLISLDIGVYIFRFIKLGELTIETLYQVTSRSVRLPHAITNAQIQIRKKWNSKLLQEKKVNQKCSA